jgi:3-hydroxyisobutyrate dehydrogenase-like beta-hydroxyacid dehydrogenase
MGAGVAAQAVAAGHPVYWLPAGRGPATRERAGHAGLAPLAGMSAMVDACWLIVSVCPPAVALEVAESVAAASFAGMYLEANAVSPAVSARIADGLAAGGATVVDGGIVGPPPRPGATTRLYLSGPDRAVGRTAAVFAGTALTPVVLEGPVGRASALKLAYASYSKISYVLAAQAAALAEAHDVLPALLDLARAKLPGTPLGQPDDLRAVAARAWRWAPEMDQVADACAAVGLTPDVAGAAARIFDRWRAHKDDPTVPLSDLLDDLSGPAA